MTAELEMLTEKIAAMAFTGSRTDIWHRLGQSFDGESMTAEEALVLSHWDREVKIYPILPPNGAIWSIPEEFHIVLQGTQLITDNGDLVDVPDKIVGRHGKGGADAHRTFTVRDRFLLAEEAVRASQGEAVWSTAGSLRGGTQGFATMEAPPIVVDPKGIADVIKRYMTVTWSFDGTRATELGGSHVRVICANTMRAHDYAKQVLIKVRHTSHTAKDRMVLAANHWAKSQDEAAALALQAQRLLEVRDGKAALGKLIEKFDPKPTDGTDAQVTRWSNRTDKVRALWEAPTNMPAVGDNGWAAWNTYVEYLDWVADVKVAKGETELDRRLGNQFDGTHDARKASAAELILSLV